ncbi:MAG: hypothetical protein J0I41_05090, partial [Filimonas sp.]|nr:hypothetical protein [Filimonas sp.]
MHPILHRSLKLFLCCLFISLTASAQFTITQNFKGNSAGSNIVLGGSPNSAYLTSGNVDPVNDGWLRLTDAITNQRGYAYVNNSFPSTLGVFMDFEYKSWRDKSDLTYNGADGFSVFMFDASSTFALGGWGGSLGYAPNTASSPSVPNGLAGGYIGLGIDEYGNYAAATEGKNGGTSSLQPNSFVLRGPTTSNSTTTNKYLTSVQLQPSSSSNINSVDYNTVTTTRPTDATFYRRVKISITPAGTSSNPLYTILVTWRTSPNGADSTLLSYTTTTAPPQNLKVGFAASTGGGFNYHEIRNLVITTPGGVRVDKVIDKANANVGDQVTYTVNAYNSTTAPIANLKFADTLKDNSGNILPIGSSGYITLNSITFNNNGGANTATGFTSGVPKTTGLTNPFSTSLNMDANSNATFTVKGTINSIPPNGILKNIAAVDPSLTGITDQDTTNNVYTVTSNVLSGNVDFVISKAVDNTCADPTNGNTYTLSVSNTGATNSVAGQTVTVTDVIPTGFTVTSASGTGWTVSNTGNTYTFKRTDALNSTFAFPAITIKVKPPSSGTSWTNTATVAYSGTEANTTNNTSNSVLIYSKPASPTVSSPVTYCQGSNGPALTATGNNLLWYTVAAGGTGSATAPVPGTTTPGSTTYYVSQSNGTCESALTSIVVNVTAAPAAPTGSATQTFCAISNPTVASLIATGTNIQWYAASTGGTALASTIALVDGTTYYATQTVNGCESINRLAVKVSITATAAPTGSATQTFCAINNPTVANLVATGTSIQWYAASTGGTALASTTALVDGTTYYASQTANGCESVSRLAVKVNITATAAPTGSATQTFCAVSNPTVANLAATGTNIQWYAASTGGTALASTTALVDGTTYYATQTANGCESASRLAVKVSITATAAPTGSATQTFCAINNPTVANLVATGTSIQWYAASTGGVALASTTALVDGTTYYASQTANGCESASRLAVKV